MPSTIPHFSAVMLVDDNEIDNLINQKMIESTGIADRIYVHSGAKAALEFLLNLSQMPETVFPERIFLDIDMPLMDGFQFLDEFAKLPEKIRESSKIVMLTSSLNPEDQKRSKASEYVVQYINKPLTQAALEGLS